MQNKPAKKNQTGGTAKPPIRGRKFQDIKNELVGAPGTPEREQYDLQFNLKVIPLKIKQYRKEHNLTQSELGARIGVQKTQISKLERNAVNVTLETLIKVFAALHTRIKIGFEPDISSAKHWEKASVLLFFAFQALALVRAF